MAMSMPFAEEAEDHGRRYIFSEYYRLQRLRLVGFGDDFKLGVVSVGCEFYTSCSRGASSLEGRVRGLGSMSKNQSSPSS